jgi:hypothetical protein
VLPPGPGTRRRNADAACGLAPPAALHWRRPPPKSATRRCCFATFSALLPRRPAPGRARWRRRRARARVAGGHRRAQPRTCLGDRA